MSVTHVTHHIQSEYQPTLWAVLLHQVPHVNITFHRLEDERFRPDSELYLESLGIIGSVPAAWLILTLIVLLIYLLTRCCDTKNNKKRKSRPIRCCLSFFSLVCCSALGAGFYGNHVFHSGAEQFSQSMVHMDRLIQHAQKQVKSFNDVLQKEVEHNLNNLYDGAFQADIKQDKAAHFELMEHSDFIFYNVTDGLKAMDNIRLKIYDPKTPISIGPIPKSVLNAEVLRWPVTMSLLGLFSLFCLLLFIGAIVHSRATLIVFSVCGLFSIILLWLLASIYVTMAVALADFCYKPTPWVQLALNHSFNLSDDISRYYLRCNEHSKQDPFQNALRESQRAVFDIEESVNRVNTIAKQHYKENQLNPSLANLVEASANTVTLMGDLNNSLKCDPLYRFYNDALVAACDQGLFGLFVMLVSASVCALFFTILVWCNSHTWIYFKHKGKYVKVEDQDPYMPLSTIDRGGRGSSMGAPIYQRSRTIHTPPQTPPYHGTLNGHGTLGSLPQHGHILSKNGTMEQKPLPGPPTLHAGVGYGHIGTLNRGVGMGPQGFMNPGHGAHSGTLGRPPKPSMQSGYATYGNNGAAATMTLGRRGHYASLRAARAGDTDLPLLGPNQGQYATLSKGCKTLESSDFY
eukprot:GFUD01004158.1.p1 GENE.GFUD01004158.1~~GFUD01004158.1.p1  ORF type:complete len:631 (-),score=66.99 GFUD01004158.1:1491-3383(-)